jgi:hypothetical protein
MNESGKLQKDVASAAEGFANAIGVAAEAVKTVDRITGSFKNTLELLLALKLASKVAGWAAAMNLFAASECCRLVGSTRTQEAWKPWGHQLSLLADVSPLAARS